MMRIRDIIRRDFRLSGDMDRCISGLVYDSRDVKGGELFFAIKGENFDGHDFIEDSIKKGAIGIVYDASRDMSDLMSKYPHIAWIGVNDTRDAIAAIANDFYGRPSEDATVIGITGTNGKTTTSYIIKSILENYGFSVGLIGTIRYLIKDESYPAHHTTPESVNFQALIREMIDKGCSHIVSEVSSHSLAQKRVDYTRFKIAIFTNLTRDHLDFHKDMEDYFRAKERLFTELLDEKGVAVINIDDTYGKRIISDIKNIEKLSSKRILTYGIYNDEADIRAYDIKTTFKGSSFRIQTSCPEFKALNSESFKSPLIGLTNVYNIIASIGVALSLNIPVNFIKEAISNTKSISGRFETIDQGQNFLAVVDYAHTEDALERLLITARKIRGNCSSNKGRIITVFGCGGNRDKGKRPLMGEIATNLSDFVIITSDNPRNEDPGKILRDIEEGIKKSNYVIIQDRKSAIQMAVEIAEQGDILIVAGKGHEDYQEIKGKRYYFSDKEAIKEAITLKKRYISK